jgi:hypothetical protein
LRGGAVKRGGAVEPVDLHEYRSGFRRAAPAQHGDGSLRLGPPDQSGDEDIRPQAHERASHPGAEARRTVT